MSDLEMSDIRELCWPSAKLMKIEKDCAVYPMYSDMAAVSVRCGKGNGKSRKIVKQSG